MCLIACCPHADLIVPNVCAPYKRLIGPAVAWLRHRTAELSHHCWQPRFDYSYLYSYGCFIVVRKLLYVMTSNFYTTLPCAPLHVIKSGVNRGQRGMWVNFVSCIIIFLLFPNLTFSKRPKELIWYVCRQLGVSACCRLIFLMLRCSSFMLACVVCFKLLSLKHNSDVWYKECEIRW